MAEIVKGTVTSLSSLFPAEEAQKAARRVEETMSERQKQLDQLRGFVSDNNNLINLVQRLPDQLHHDIMVPFGKAAFFPGRLIHTNEFLVLLGEGYYAERTANKTVEMLNRRRKDLEVQVESVKAVMQDLKAEASFFDATASDAAEGLVEIREDYVDETSPKHASSTGVLKPEHSISSQVDDRPRTEDEEYDYIFSRMDELEKEEEEADKANIEELGSPGSDISASHGISEEEMKILEVEGSKATSKDNCFLPGNLVYSKSNLTDDAPAKTQVKEDVTDSVVAENKASAPLTEPHFDSSKAFTGSIIEHASNLDINSSEHSLNRGSKPVSRFRMRRK